MTARILHGWFKKRAKVKFTERLEVCLRRFSPEEDVRPCKLTVRAMTRRWGSLTALRNMTLHIRLVGASIHCIDYVITHQLCHALIPYHGHVLRFAGQKTSKLVEPEGQIRTSLSLT
ncbi:YgjP-like metallopeptidase domain-containing protein [Alsobacter ponti]|uniref:YgjP-like metallopeptidase domain-containing protein n=1 Tax=Alsobacter ponti TaxID=2962936 RepID=UPI003530B47A